MLSEEIKELLKEINSVYKKNNWLEVKKYLLKSLEPKKRKKFSTRDYNTKKHKLNNYEKSIIIYYEEKYNILLKIPSDKKHKKNFWEG